MPGKVCCRSAAAARSDAAQRGRLQIDALCPDRCAQNVAWEELVQKGSRIGAQGMALHQRLRFFPPPPPAAALPPAASANSAISTSLPVHCLPAFLLSATALCRNASISATAVAKL